MRTTTITCGVLAILLAVTGACHRDSSGGTAASASKKAAAKAPDPDDLPVVGHCAVTISGDVNAIVTSDETEASISTDFWETEQALRDRVAIVANEAESPMTAPLDRMTTDMLERNPKYNPMFILCGRNGVIVTLTPSLATRYEDLVFGPRQYMIAGDLGETEAPAAGTFVATVTMPTQPPDQVFRLWQPGAIEITRFDLTGLTGRFWFAAAVVAPREAIGRRIKVVGEFAFNCVGARCPASLAHQNK